MRGVAILQYSHYTADLWDWGGGHTLNNSRKKSGLRLGWGQGCGYALIFYGSGSIAVLLNAGPDSVPAAFLMQILIWIQLNKMCNKLPNEGFSGFEKDQKDSSK